MIAESRVAPTVVETTLVGSHGVVPGNEVVVHCVQEPEDDFASIVPPTRIHWRAGRPQQISPVSTTLQTTVTRIGLVRLSVFAVFMGTNKDESE